MLIISKFHDFYDVGMKLGIDKTAVYDRKTVDIEGKFLTVTRYMPHDSWHTMVLAFCGNFYPFVYHVDTCNVDKIIWDVEEAVNTIPQKSGRWSRYWDEDALDTEIGVRKFFDREYAELEHLYHKHRTPIFAFQPHPLRRYSWRKEGLYKSLTINPNLKDIQFYKVKDPITAYQEVYMFLSGVIGSPIKEAKPIDDKIMAASKGHDGEFSFKKPPGKRGKNKWR